MNKNTQKNIFKFYNLLADANQRLYTYIYCLVRFIYLHLPHPVKPIKSSTQFENKFRNYKPKMYFNKILALSRCGETEIELGTLFIPLLRVHSLYETFVHAQE